MKNIIDVLHITVGLTLLVAPTVDISHHLVKNSSHLGIIIDRPCEDTDAKLCGIYRLLKMAAT